jgi:hypothetical protein
MSKYLSKLFAMLKTAEVEIKKVHNMLMVNETTDFKKSDRKTKGPKGKKPQMDGKFVASLPRHLSQSPESSASTTRGMVTGSAISRSTLKTRRPARFARDKCMCDIHIIDIYLTSAQSNTWIFDTGSVAHICNPRQDLKSKRRLVRNKVTTLVGSGYRVDIVAIGTLHLQLPSRFL